MLVELEFLHFTYFVVHAHIKYDHEDKKFHFQELLSACEEVRGYLYAVINTKKYFDSSPAPDVKSRME